MVSVTVLDTSAAKSKPAVLKAAKKLSVVLKLEKKSVEIFLVGNKQMRKNVLAFPANPAFPRPDLEKPPVGEIYLNPSYIEKNPVPLPPEVMNWKLKIPAQLAYMLIHGYLHLLGYDHEAARDRMKMEKEERQLLQELANT